MAVATRHSVEGVQRGIRDIATRWSRERADRQQRRELHASDFAEIAKTGFLELVVPTEAGGLWAATATSTRAVCEVLRELARADSSVALVSSMHLTVVYLCWLSDLEAPPERARAWDSQRREVFRSIQDGAWYGTITSEPGSGGDVTKTKATAEPIADGRYRFSGTKHFGSGSGITSYMMTSALPTDTKAPEIFCMDVRGARWDGSTGITLLSPWDGHGMIATQSHAFRFDGYTAAPFLSCAFSAVIVGIVEAAMEAARQAIGPKRTTLRAYEQVEWAQANVEAWLIAQAYEGMLRAMERESGRGTLEGKTAIADLAESLTSRLCKIVGGGTFGRGSPFGHFAEDVRALGFLRPPWGLAYDRLFESSWAS
ncbi:MAG: hypothetical protein AUI83_03445 [Armatimonadetes bacterium 13_1_40CM_3_65_7]|nr:MAG: hypothetical protein AUI83_03445 [Armatimonadetes bacterium 13_1_40CM_3_65_7]